METTAKSCDEQFESGVLAEGTALLNGQYVIERYLSSGGFGITYFAKDSLDRRVVIKECFPEAYCSRQNQTVMARSQSRQGEFKAIVDMFVREAHSIAKLKHPNIVGVHQVFQDNQTAYMALDLVDGKDLLDIIEASNKRPTYVEVNSILLKLLDAISTVHAQDILHRDISPDNILIDAWDNPILIDFGAAREEASKKTRALSAVLVVKDGYSPQEFYIAGSQQTPCSDLYALAATFVHLISGDAPPNSQTRLATIASGKGDPYRPLSGRIENYPRAFLEAIDTAMNVFPQDRIQTAQDWLVRIDEPTRKAAALRHAKSDQQIEKTVALLIKSAQHEAGAITATAADAIACPQVPNHAPGTSRYATPPSNPESEKMPASDALDWGDLSDYQDRDHLVATTQIQASNWVAKCRQKAEQEPALRNRKRPIAMMVMVMTLSVVFFDDYGHTIPSFFGTDGFVFPKP